VPLVSRFLERLKQTSDESGTSLERQRVVGSLSALLPRSVVTSQYRGVRQLQLDQCFDHYLYPQGDRKLTSEDSVEGFRAALDKILLMMDSDFELLMTGCLSEELDEAFQMLGDIYFDRIHDEIQMLVDHMTK